MPDDYFYFGQWLTDICLKDPNFPNGFVFGKTQTIRGCWGDCNGTANFMEDNRLQTTRNSDGTLLGFCWLDTDTLLHPSSNDYDNSNPDLWIRFVRVKADGKYNLSQKSRNETKGSSIDGNVVCGNISPYMLPASGQDSVFKVPTSALVLSGFNGTTSPWPVQHVYLNGITTVAKQDSFPIEVQLFRITGSNALHIGSRNANLALSPNPTSNSLTVNLSTPKPSKASFTLTNSLGQVTERKSVSVLEGDNRIPFNTSAYKPGIYFLNVSVGDQRVSKRFVKE